MQTRKPRKKIAKAGHTPEGLTVREDKFVKHFVATRNKSEAARLSGYSKGWVSRSWEIAARPHVAKAIEKLTRQVEVKAERKAADVIGELGAIGFQDPTGYIVKLEDGLWRWKTPEELTELQRAAIKTVRIHEKEVEVEGAKVKTQSFRYTFHDKMAALVALGRHFSLFEDNLNVRHQLPREFMNVPDDELRRLREQFVRMIDGDAIEGEVVNGKVLSHDRGHGERT